MFIKIVLSLILVVFGFYVFLSCVNHGNEIAENTSLSKDAKKHVSLCEISSYIFIFFLLFFIWYNPDTSHCTLSEEDYGMLMGCIDELSFLCDKYSDNPDDEINTLLNLMSDTLESNYIEMK